MKLPIYAAVAVTLLAVTACQPNLPAGTVIAVPAPPPMPPPPPPPTMYAAPMPTYIEPVPKPRYNYYVKGPRGNWAAKRCGPGMHWQSSRRVPVKLEGVPGTTKVVPGRCVRN
jgi:hypothetical protein